MKYSAKRSDSHVLENLLAYAFTKVRPMILFGKNNELADGRDGFGGIKDHDVWIGKNSDSFKRTLMDRVRDFVHGVQGLLLGHKGAWTILARWLLQECVSQMQELCGYITNEYDTLVNVAGFVPQSSWRLIGRSVRACFDDTRRYRAPVARLEDLNTAETRGKFLWAVFQNHLLWTRVIRQNFRAYQAVVAETTLFMLTERVDPSETAELTRRLIAVEANKHMVSDLREENKDLKRRLNDLANKVKQLKKKS